MNKQFKEMAETYIEEINSNQRKENWTEVHFYAKRLMEITKVPEMIECPRCGDLMPKGNPLCRECQ